MRNYESDFNDACTEQWPNVQLTTALYFCIISGLLCLIVFKCFSAVFVDYRILTTLIDISDIKMFVNSMFKAEWLGF